MSAAGLVLTLAGVLLGAPALVLLGLAAAVCGAAMRWMPGDVAPAVAVAVLLSLAVGLGLTAHLLGVDLLAAPRAVSVALVLVAGGATWCATGPSRRAAGLPVPQGHRWAYAPAAVAVGIGLLQAASVRLSTSWTALGTDLAQHTIFVSQIQQSGALDYSADGYPRAFHMLVALVSAPGLPPAGSVAHLQHDVQLVAAATWFCLAVVVCTATATAVRIASRRGGPARATVACGAVVGATLLLLNPFVSVFILLGAPTSLLALVVLWLPTLLLLTQPGGRPSNVAFLCASAVGLMLLAHLWQPLILPAAFWLGTSLLSMLFRHRRQQRSATPSPGAWAALGLAGLVLAGATAAPLWGVQRAGGTSLAAIPGEAEPVPAALLALAGLTALVLMIRPGWRRTPWARVLLGGAVGLSAAVLALAHGSGNPTDLSQYYPMKALWFGCLYLLPVGVVMGVEAGRAACGRIWRLLGCWSPGARVLRTTLIAVCLASAGAFALPPALEYRPLAVLAVDADAAAQGQHRFAIAAEQGARYGSAVTVPVAVGVTDVPNAIADSVVSRLISVRTGQAVNAGSVLSVCEQVGAVTEGREAVVVSELRAALLEEHMRRQGCGGLRVVHLPGGSPKGLALIESMLTPQAAGPGEPAGAR